MLLTRRSLLRDCENVANLCFQLYCSPTPGSWASVCANLVKWYRQHSAAARRRAICQLRALSRALPRRAGTRAKNAPSRGCGSTFSGDGLVVAANLPVQDIWLNDIKILCLHSEKYHNGWNCTLHSLLGRGLCNNVYSSIIINVQYSQYWYKPACNN